MNTINSLTRDRKQLVLSTISSAYQTEFEKLAKTRDDAFAMRVALALTSAGITRSDKTTKDQIDIIFLHVQAHEDWFAGVYRNQPLGYTFRNYLADILVRAGFLLDESKCSADDLPSIHHHPRIAQKESA